MQFCLFPKKKTKETLQRGHVSQKWVQLDSFAREKKKTEMKTCIDISRKNLGKQKEEKN